VVGKEPEHTSKSKAAIGCRYHVCAERSEDTVIAGAHIDVAQHRLGVGLIGLPVEVQHEERRLGHVVDMQELAPRRAGAPDHDLVAPLLCRLVEAADQRGQDVAVLGVEIVAGPVEVRGHDRAVVDPYWRL
jgi:hypothetical protein